MTAGRTAQVLLILLLASACRTSAGRLYGPKPDEPTKPVWIVDHGLHTGVALARADVPSAVWPEVDDFRGSTYLEVGWGDRDYYQARRPTLGLALKATFRSRASVLHIVGFDAPVGDFFPGTGIVELRLSQRGFDELCRFIHASYARSGSGHTITLGPGAYDNSSFYLATGQYHLLNNCNNWTAKAIRSAGYPMTPTCAITAGSVMHQASGFGRIIRRAAPVTVDPYVGSPLGPCPVGIE